MIDNLYLVVSFCRRALSSSTPSAAAAAAAQMQVQGDLSAVLSEVDAVVSREDAKPKDIADAAMALAYLQARGDRRWADIAVPSFSRWCQMCTPAYSSCVILQIGSNSGAVAAATHQALPVERLLWSSDRLLVLGYLQENRLLQQKLQQLRSSRISCDAL